MEGWVIEWWRAGYQSNQTILKAYHHSTTESCWHWDILGHFYKKGKQVENRLTGWVKSSLVSTWKSPCSMLWVALVLHMRMCHMSCQTAHIEGKGESFTWSYKLGSWPTTNIDITWVIHVAVVPYDVNGYSDCSLPHGPSVYFHICIDSPQILFINLYMIHLDKC